MEVEQPQLRLKSGSDFYTQDNPVDKEIYFVLEEMDMDSGGEVVKYLNTICPNLTVCPECRVDDFVHIQGCSMDRFNKKEETE